MHPVCEQFKLSVPGTYTVLASVCMANVESHTTYKPPILQTVLCQEAQQGPEEHLAQSDPDHKC